MAREVGGGPSEAGGGSEPGAGGVESDANSLPGYLWLSSELTGIIESPAYYFSAVNDEIKAATDNLVLVHGWRRFNWEQVLNDNRPAFEYTPEFDGHIITCRVKHNTDNENLAPTDAWLSIPGIQLQFYNSKINKDGKVNIIDFSILLYQWTGS